MALVTCTTAALMFTQSVFWSLPTAVLAGTAAAAGIAWINSVGNLAGYLSPFLVGRVRDVSGTMTWAYFALGASCLVASVILLAVARSRTGGIPPETAPGVFQRRMDVR